jgi:hypothetical protein
MKVNIVLAALLCLALAGCENLFDGDDEKKEEKKTEAELRAERNKPIYEQFIGEWDNYYDEALTIKTAEKIKPTSSKFFDNVDKAIDYSDLIYTLEEFKAVIEYSGSVPSNDLTKDGYIKLKMTNDVEWIRVDNKLVETDQFSYAFFEYHFYDKDTLKLKMVTAHTTDVDLPVGERDKLVYDEPLAVGCYYKRVGSGSSGSGEQVDLPGAYELMQGSNTCTLTFNSNGTYVFDHPDGSHDRNGTWTQDGGELTMKYTVTETGTDIEEVFITTEEGNVVTLTLKDTSASISQIFASFNITATSVELTRK